MIKDRECISTESRRGTDISPEFSKPTNDVAQPLEFCLGAICITVLVDGSVTGQARGIPQGLSPAPPLRNFPGLVRHPSSFTYCSAGWPDSLSFVCLGLSLRVRAATACEAKLSAPMIAST